jgi:hypothetical protein
MYSRAIEQLKTTLKLSDIQREILVGALLGDAHLETQNRGRTYRVKFEYSAKHREYAEHLYGLFREWVRTPLQGKLDDSHDNVWFQTLSHPAFRFYAHQFYDEHRKCVPRNIHRLLTARSIAYWFMDDGSMKSRESKGVIFNTQGFARKDVKRLVDVLRSQFKLEARERRQREGWQIYISGKSHERFREIVVPFLHPSMLYKLPVDRKTKMPKR